MKKSLLVIAAFAIATGTNLQATAAPTKVKKRVQFNLAANEVRTFKKDDVVKKPAASTKPSIVKPSAFTRFAKLITNNKGKIAASTIATAALALGAYYGIPAYQRNNSADINRQKPSFIEACMFVGVMAVGAAQDIYCLSYQL
jgi:hypothetical protein